VGVVYHPPKPTYDLDSFKVVEERILDYLEATVDEITCKFPTSEIVMVGDFNHLLDTDLTQRTGLAQIVDRPTRGSNTLDRIFESIPIVHGRQSYNVYSQKRSSGYYSFTGSQPKDINKKRTVLQYRPRTPDQHPAFWHTSLTSTGTTLLTLLILKLLLIFFMLTALSMLDTFYPLHTVTVTNRDPYFVTPKIKSLFRKHNRLMRRGRIEKPESVTKRISRSIVDHAKVTFSPSRRGSKELWEKVRQIAHKTKSDSCLNQVTVAELNQHFATISTSRR